MKNILVFVLLSIMYQAKCQQVYWASYQSGDAVLIDETGTETSSVKFQTISYPKNGSRVVDGYRGVGLLDSTGHWVVAPIYLKVRKFKNQYAAVVDSIYWGFVNDKGEISVPTIYDKVHDFSEEMAAVTQNGKWGFVNPLGQLVIPCQFSTYKPRGVAFDDLSPPNSKRDGIGEFHEGYAPVSDQHGKWGIIDTTGQWVVAPVYEYIHSIREGIAGFVQNGKLGYIDVKGNVIIKAQYDDHFFSRSFHDGLVCVRKNKKWGVANRKGQFLTGLKYTNIKDFENGHALVRYDRQWGIMDTTGKWVVKPSLTGIKGSFTDGYVLARLNGLYGVLNLTGKWIIKPKYDNAQYFIKKQLCVSKNGKWGVIDINDRTIIPFQFDDLYYLDENVFAYKDAGYYGLIDEKGEILTDAQFEWINHFYQGLAVVRVNDLAAVINKQGEYLIPPKYYILEGWVREYDYPTYDYNK